MAEHELTRELARFIERVSAIARTGLAFQNSGFDAERYEELLRAAARMKAALEVEDAAAHQTVYQKWRESVVDGYDGYVTAGVGCGAIAFNERDEILMIQRMNGRWWYPTGFCDVGQSPAENVAREVREETGLIATPTRLIGVFDSQKLGSPMRQIYSMLFYCRLEGGEIRPHPLETLQVGFYPSEQLPEPMHGANRKWITLAREFHFDGRTEAYFDPL